jgi:transposase
MKALALLLYAMGNMSLSGIGRLLGVSDVAVLKWVRAEGQKLPEPEMPADVEVVMLDEMHHFLKKRQTSFGFGERLILSSAELCPGFWVAVMMQPAESTSTGSGLKAEPS